MGVTGFINLWSMRFALHQSKQQKKRAKRESAREGHLSEFSV